jgi:hypothetical protein
MADENDEIYNLSPAVINETVLAARNYLKTHPEDIARASTRNKGSEESAAIAQFLGWPVERIEEALAQLSDIVWVLLF